MPIIRTHLTPAQHTALITMMKAEGFASIPELFRAKTACTRKDEAHAICTRALQLALDLDVGVTFRMRSLFDSRTWETWPVGSRLRAGKMFTAKVASGSVALRLSHKDSANHRIFVRT